MKNPGSTRAVSDSAVRLSHRYITGRQLPDKAVSLLDTACARVAIGLHAIPPDVYDRDYFLSEICEGFEEAQADTVQ